MKSLTKTLFTTFLFGALALTSCGGGGLKNVKEVSAVEYTTAATVAEAKNTFNHAVAKGTYEMSGAGQTQKLDINLGFDLIQGVWTPEISGYEQFSITTASSALLILGQVMVAGGMPTTGLKTFTADNGFKLEAEGKGSVTQQSVTMATELKCTMEFNEFGLVTSETEYEGVSVAGVSIVQNINVKVTYSTVN